MNLQNKKPEQDFQPDWKEMGILVVAPPGWGKTELFKDAPNTLHIACESGHRFVNTNKIIIDSWDGDEDGEGEDGLQHTSFLNLVRFLSKESQGIRTLIIDTVDALNRMCVKHFTKRGKVDHISELGDYGKGYDIAQNIPMNNAISTLLQNYGVIFLTHQDIAQRPNAKGATIQKKETSLPNGVMRFLYPQVDIIMQGEFGKLDKSTGKRIRLVRTEGSENILAKNRGGFVPSKFILPENGVERYNIFNNFFNDPSSLKKAEAQFDLAAEGEIQEIETPQVETETETENKKTNKKK